MNKTDKIYRATAMNDQFRVIAADTTNTCQTARDLHDLSPISTILMGRLIIAIAMMSTELKDPCSELSLRIDSDQPLRGALAIINGWVT
jgi:molecular chaperone Hsp33